MTHSYDPIAWEVEAEGSEIPYGPSLAHAWYGSTETVFTHFLGTKGLFTCGTVKKSGQRELEAAGHIKCICQAEAFSPATHMI